MEAFAVSQPKISRHLAQLRSCGILNDTRKGQWVYYSISKTLPNWTVITLDALSKASSAQIKQFKHNLKTMKNRPICC